MGLARVALTIQETDVNVPAALQGPAANTTSIFNALVEIIW